MSEDVNASTTPTGSPEPNGLATIESEPGTNTAPDVEAPKETTPDAEQEPKGRKNEAARYRVRLREVEAQLQEHAATIESLEKQLVSYFSTLPKTEALWAGGVEIDELRDEQGNISRELVAAADQRVREQFGIGHRSLPKPDPAQGRGGGAKPGKGFSSAFKL